MIQLNLTRRNRDDKRNEGNYIRNVINKSGKNIWVKRIDLFFEHAFPSYDYMQSYPGCGYLEGKPYLLPVSWLHRFYIYYRRNNRTPIKPKIMRIFTEQKILDKQEEFLNKMGL